MRQVRSGLSWIAFLAAVAGWHFFLAPPALGGRTTYVVIHGTSMNPVYKTGDLVLVRPEANYTAGDIAAYTVTMGGGTNVVIHRVTGELTTGELVLQGDNRDQPDPWHPRPAEVVGRPVAHIPGLGLLAARLAASPLLLGAVCGLLAGLTVALSTPRSSPLPALQT